MRFYIILYTLCIATVVLARSKKGGKHKTPVDVQLITCTQMYANISCPHGYYISIKKAMYGRLRADVCETDKKKQGDLKCSDPNALAITQRICNNKRSCSIKAWTEPFSDPCVGVDKYLDITYQCVLCEDCGPNERFRVDWSNCEPACEELHALDTTECVTKPGCACKPGLVRDTIVSNKCVAPERCPFFDIDFPLCRTNEEYCECGTNCTSTCQRDESEIECTKECIPGFFCCKGFIRDETDGRCIKADDCPCPPE